MTEQTPNTDTQTPERPILVDLIRKVLLAGIGAATLAQEEAEAFIHKLIERGEIAEKDGWGLMKDLREKRRSATEDELEKQLASLLERMNIPTKSDIYILSEKINEVATKLDELKTT